ncbi:MAG TPA: LPS assembly protein LptD [Steroidobacteraceae bacterium]|nr:LPS assembly protein LptD [Steroidobacteraceae bacterium]
MLPLRPSPPLCGPSRPRQLDRRALGSLAAWTLATLPLCGVSQAQQSQLLDDPPLRPDAPFCPSDVRAGAGPFAKETRPNPNAKLDITADQLLYNLTGNATLDGNVVVRQGDREVRSDHAQYDRATGDVTVRGSVTYQDPIVRLSGSNGKYSPTAGTEVHSAQFSLIQRYGRGSANLLELSPQGILDLRGVRFTTCPVADQSWQLRAKDLSLDTNRQSGTGRDAVVDFQGVPILYLPWFSFPLSNERKSGFLFPSAGNSSVNGIELQVPYYWNLAPNADATFSPEIYSHRGVDLAGEARFLTDDQNGELQWHFLPDDQRFETEAQDLVNAGQQAGLPVSSIGSNDRSFVTFHDLVTLPDDMRVLIDAANVSDPLYFQDFGSGPETTSTAFLQRLAQLTYRDEHWNLGAAAQQYQPVSVDLPVPSEYLPDEYRPYARAPWLWADGDFGFGPGELLRYGIDSELVDFIRSGLSGWRLDLMPHVGLDYEDPGYFIRSTFDWRYTQYELGNTLPDQSSSPSRSLPIASFDTGLKLERPWENDRTLTLEPRMFYLYVPYRNQDDLPLFDTALPDLNTVELFRDNRYVGADRQSDADQVTLGLTSRLVASDTGLQYFSATLGQSYYLETPRVELPGETLDGRADSDLVGEFVLSAYKNWNVNVNLEWNPATDQEERTFAQLQFKPGDESVINLAYRYQRDVVLPSALATPGEIPAVLGEVPPQQEVCKATGLPQEQVCTLNQSLNQSELSAAWPISHGWHLLGRWVYDYDSHEGIDRLAGFEYRACCWRVRLLYRRYLINGTGQEDTAFMFQIQLSGLAGVGPATDAFLGTAIQGYSPPSLTR